MRTVEPELDFKISDFGTRRRFSLAWHEEVVQTLKREVPQYFAGTSNVWFAMRNNLTPLGTMAHEYMQACQALGPRLRDSQTFAFDKWAQEYRGDLGIAIADTYGLDAFLRDFDMYFCKLFDGARHDSGDPFDWGEKMIAHYRRNRVDPRTKTLIFSDQLSLPLAIEIARRFHGRARTAFGIGTNLTNDLGYEPINIVIKMTECNGQPVAKVSDAPGKTISKDAGLPALPAPGLRPRAGRKDLKTAARGPRGLLRPQHVRARAGRHLRGIPAAARARVRLDALAAHQRVFDLPAGERLHRAAGRPGVRPARPALGLRRRHGVPRRGLLPRRRHRQPLAVLSSSSACWSASASA